MKNLFQALCLLILLCSCSKQALISEPPEPDQLMETPKLETANPCPSVLRPDFRPAALTPNNCVNYLQHIFHGTFGINDHGNWATEINCIQNPTNWNFSFQYHEELTYFQLLVDYPTYVPDDGGPRVYISGNDLQIRFAGDCNASNFIYTSSANSGNNKAHFHIFMNPNFWDCYEIGEPFEFTFFVTGSYDFPIEEA